MKSAPEEALAWQIKAARLPRLPMPAREHRFAPPRRYRFDFAWLEQMVAAEVEGGTWIHGAHNRGAHFKSDCEKYNLAVILGWRVLRFTTAMIEDGRAIKTLELVLRGKQ